MPLLSWFNRDADLTRAARTPYRLLEPVASLSHGDPDSPNMLIEGDNLDALKALLPYYAGQVKCIFIDPPYNTRSAFEHYDDNLEHSQWLSMMYPRLELLRELLSEDGSIWVTLDDNEAHYFKVISDEIFGRKNLLGNIIWQHSVQGKNDAKKISLHHNHLFLYRKSEAFELKKLPRTNDHNVNYRNQDNDPRGPWRPGDVRSPNFRENLRYNIETPSGKTIEAPAKGWRWSKELFLEKVASREIVFLDDDTRVLRKIYLSDQEGRVAESIWFGNEVGTTREASGELASALPGVEIFATPKPERLIQRVLEAATQFGDLVLDSFLGSGTTSAVAHKMGRRWIGIEMGEHARTHCQPRLVKVVEGEQGGISEAVGWNGGGGFRFYKLGVPVFDENGHIREGIRFEHLAAHVWFAETGTARSTRTKKEAFLGEHGGIGYYLLFNGILGDDSKSGGNLLTRRVLRSLPKFDGPKVIYGEACTLPEEQLRELDITFRQTPYDIKAR
ncbi:adenine-specific DNA-methyltransferase [Luteimonas cucumeris]|uniref:site-specific DNA-methyltransferase (adenine-specific) n=1 Tax=Luteimonas cucumeris TaxID=985012 RepID=A0A562L2C8_9GAMM|nr:site-specific DNA-methyltransferase [Luteimonas cucumeris]TWI01785.1 adenine-specific DNA-methyltransferase [Luteimonas cucumeris]